MEYKIFAQKAFESTEKLEKRLNEMSREGWRVITNMGPGGYFVLAKER